MRRVKTVLVLLIAVGVMVSHYTAEARGETKDSHEVDRLIGDLKDASWQIRWYAAEALGGLKDPRAVEPLIAALKDEIKDVRRRAAEALANIAGKDFGKDPVKWQEW